MKHIIQISTFALLLLSLSACKEELIEPLAAPATSRIQLVQTSPSLDPTRNVEFYTSDVMFGNNNRKANLAYGGTAAINYTSGNILLKTRLNEDENPLLSGSYLADNYSNFTAILANVDGNNTSLTAPVGLAIVKDDLVAAQEGNFKVRLVHLGIESGEVDVYLYTGSTQPSPVATVNYAKAFPGNTSLILSANQVSEPVNLDFQSLPIGQYQVKIRPSGADPTSTPIAQSTITFANRRCYTLILRGYKTQPDGLTGRSLSIQNILHERLAF